jgi:hypothetical protein
MRGILLTGLVALLAVGVAPLASAQPIPPPTFAIDALAPVPPLVADIGSQEVKIPWTYTYTLPGQSAAGLISSNARLVWKAPACDAAGVKVIGPLSESIELVPSTGPPPATVKGESRFLVAATSAAPGEVGIACTFSGHVEANTAAVPASNTATASLNVVVSFLAVLGAEVPVTIAEAGPQKEVTFDIRVRNFGNALTLVTPEVISPSEDGWLAIAPVPFVVGSLQQGSDRHEATVPFVVVTPHREGWNNDEAAFQVRLTPSSTKDGAQVGNPIVVSFLARVRGYYCSEVETCRALLPELRGPDCRISAPECEEHARKVEAMLARVDAKASPSAFLGAFAAVAAAVLLRRRRA